ncbi:MAG: hypothetical protein K6G85_09145 [Eubacterium sp.]|nr:hypothetical protein [Eubacterium sp.]
MIDLKCTETGIYYIHDYIPTRSFSRYSDSEVEMSKKIWDYKNCEQEALDLFTNELMEAITIIAKKTSRYNIGLVAVPPSKVNKESTVGVSIWNIHNWYDEGITKAEFGCIETIYDYSGLLTRITDVSTSHEGRRATYDEHKASIRCSRDRLFRYRTAFILIDDVTTRGTIMDACRDILIENGASEDIIFRLAIAKTV